MYIVMLFLFSVFFVCTYFMCSQILFHVCICSCWYIPKLQFACIKKDEDRYVLDVLSTEITEGPNND